MEVANAAAAKKNMCVTHLAQLRVTHLFIKKVMAFSVCQEPVYSEQASLDWKA
jgi:hypothetical protein